MIELRCGKHTTPPSGQGQFLWTERPDGVPEQALVAFLQRIEKTVPESSEAVAQGWCAMWCGAAPADAEWLGLYRLLDGGRDFRGRPNIRCLACVFIRRDQVEGIDLWPVFFLPCMSDASVDRCGGNLRCPVPVPETVWALRIPQRSAATARNTLRRWVATPDASVFHCRIAHDGAVNDELQPCVSLRSTDVTPPRETPLDPPAPQVTASAAPIRSGTRRILIAATIAASMGVLLGMSFKSGRLDPLSETTPSIVPQPPVRPSPPMATMNGAAHLRLPLSGQAIPDVVVSLVIPPTVPFTCRLPLGGTEASGLGLDMLQRSYRLAVRPLQFSERLLTIADTGTCVLILGGGRSVTLSVQATSNRVWSVAEAVDLTAQRLANRSVLIATCDDPLAGPQALELVSTMPPVSADHASSADRRQGSALTTDR